MLRIDMICADWGTYSFEYNDDERTNFSSGCSHNGSLEESLQLRDA